MNIIKAIVSREDIAFSRNISGYGSAIESDGFWGTAAASNPTLLGGSLGGSTFPG